MPPISCGDTRRCVGFLMRNPIIPVSSGSGKKRGKEEEEEAV
jgi:hypothetical protein